MLRYIPTEIHLDIKEEEYFMYTEYRICIETFFLFSALTMLIGLCQPERQSLPNSYIVILK